MPQSPKNVKRSVFKKCEDATKNSIPGPDRASGKDEGQGCAAVPATSGPAPESARALSGLRPGRRLRRRSRLEAADFDVVAPPSHEELSAGRATAVGIEAGNVPDIDIAEVFARAFRQVYGRTDRRSIHSALLDAFVRAIRRDDS